MKALEWKTNEERAMEIANRVIKARKALKITQKRLAVLSGVTYASIRRFERTGLISFLSFISIATALGYEDDLNNLYKDIMYLNIEDALKK